MENQIPVISAEEFNALSKGEQGKVLKQVRGATGEKLEQCLVMIQSNQLISE